jgi:DNA-binding transcriptional LysR family regulator
MDWTDRVGSRIKIRDLHILLAVAEWGSMAQAAKRLAVSQPVISKAIADLEKSVGERLLDRMPHGVVPTVYGRALISRGIAVFEELRQGVLDIRFLADPTAGEIRMGSTDSFAGGTVAAIIDHLSRRHPRLAYYVQTADAPTLLYHDLREHTVEFLFGRIVMPVEDGLDAEVLFHERLCVVAGHRSHWSRRRKISVIDLADQPWTFAPYADSLEALKASGLPNPKATVATLSIHLFSTLIATGRFIGICPSSMVRFGAVGRTMKVLPIDLAAPPRPVGIIKIQDRVLSPMAELFIEAARTIAKPLANDRVQPR